MRDWYTCLLFFDFGLETVFTHALPHRLSHGASNTIGSYNQVAFIHGSICTVNADTIWKILDVDGLLINQDSVPMISKLAVQLLQNALAIHKSSAITMPIKT